MNASDDNLHAIGERLRQARGNTTDVLAEAENAALQALHEGATEAGVARALGVDRMTIRKWAGKR